MRLTTSALTAVSAPSVGPGVTLAGVGPSAARTQGAVLGGAKRKSEDAAARSVSAAARGARGLADGAQAHNRFKSAGVDAVHPVDVNAAVAVGVSSLTSAARPMPSALLTVDTRPIFALATGARISQGRYGTATNACTTTTTKESNR